VEDFPYGESRPAKIDWNPQGDGSCQFAAVSHQLRTRGIRDITPEELRAKVVEYLKENDQSAFIPGLDWETYVSLMSEHETFGDHMTLNAMARICNIQIVVLSTKEKPYTRLISSLSEDKLSDEIPYMIIGHNTDSKHFVSIKIENDDYQKIAQLIEEASRKRVNPSANHGKVAYELSDIVIFWININK